MPIYDYSTLINEVSYTNELLEQQNNKIDKFSTTTTILIMAVLFLKASDMIHHLFDATYKF